MINPMQVKVNDFIGYKVNDEWVTGTIMGLAGKSDRKVQDMVPCKRWK